MNAFWGAYQSTNKTNTDYQRKTLGPPLIQKFPLSAEGGKKKKKVKQQLDFHNNPNSSLDCRIMPRENQKRGRRAAEKANKDTLKRKHDDAPEQPPKRQKPESTEDEITGGADYIPLGEEMQIDGEGHDQMQGGDMPFYGLLDTEEQEYFSRANEMLELDQFGDAEERRLFIDSVYREANGKELKIACSQSCSRLMEKLIAASDMRQIRRLFNKFIGHFLHLVQHRFASHCCEALFVSAAPGVMDKPSKAKAKRNEEEDEEDDPEPELSLAEMFMKVVEELEGNWGYLLTERFASHTIRVLLLVLGGEPVDVTSNDSVVASRKKERVGAKMESREETVVAEKRSVPDTFVKTLKKIIKDIISVLDDTYLRALATHPVGNPVLQVLVSLEILHFGKAATKDSNSIIRKLIPDEEFQEGSEGTSFIRGLLYDPVGSRLVETIVRCVHGKLFKSFYRNFFHDQIASLARNITAGYVVLRVLERLGKDDLKEAVERLSPQIPSLIERGRLVVPKVLIERCLVRGVDTNALARSFESAYDKDPARRLNQILRRENTSSDAANQPNAEFKEPGADQGQAPTAAERLHGSLLAQTMLTARGPLSGLIHSSLLAQSSESLLELAKDPTASRVLQQAMTLPTSTPQFRRQFTTRFQGHLVELALDSSGSHVVDALWPATNDIYFVKERMAQELAQQEMTLRDSFVGRAVWKNWSMDLYKRRRGEWGAKAKGIDRGDGTGERPKSKIELARARFAAKAEEATKADGAAKP